MRPGREGLAAGRVAQLRVELHAGERRGSGYRVTSTAVLTAAHVVAEARSVQVVFNPDLPDEWAVPATVAMCEPAGDVAVVVIDAPEAHRYVAPVRFGQIGMRPAVLPCRAVGFPRFKLRNDLADPGTAYRDVHQADGTIASLSNWREGTVEITVAPPDRDSDPDRSPWEGMSGAAVWCGDCIIGVVSRHHRNEGTNRLAAVRASRWFQLLDADRLRDLGELVGLPAAVRQLEDVIPPDPAGGGNDVHRAREETRAEEADPREFLCRQLNRLYELAGKPTLANLQRPGRTVSDATLRDWLNGKHVPRNAGVLKRLVEVLLGEARERHPASTLTWCSSPHVWERWWQAATARPPRLVRPSRDQFRRTRSAFRDRRKLARLIESALALHGSGDVSDPDLPLLTWPGWIPDRPLALDSVRLRFTARPADHRLARARALAARYWPAVSGVPIRRYSDAVAELDPPEQFYDGRSYRLLEVAPSAGRIDLTFTDGMYFDAFDTAEPLAFEAAQVYDATDGETITGPYRRALGDPFEFGNRCALPGINTLTVRRSRRGPNTFYLHRRTRTATAQNTVHVVPAGEFQPHHESDRSATNQLDLRFTMLREYAEEFLGLEEAAEATYYVPFEVREPYATLHRAFQPGGGVSCRLLGIGLYPLTWKPEILTVAIFDARTFDRLFADMVDENLEGKLVVTERLRGIHHVLTGRRGRCQGIPFVQEMIDEYAGDSSTLPAARACLKLAWRHRRTLEIG